MTILVIDTETTGFLQSRAPLDDPGQPHIVQLAAQLCDDAGAILAGFSFIVDPGIKHGIRIPQQAADIHGITEARAAEFGVPLGFALETFARLYQRADLLVAHNIAFDRGVIDVAITRHRGTAANLLSKPLFCTMAAAAPIVNLPPTPKMLAKGIRKPKAPKLEEAVRHFFGEDLDGAHDAMVDVIACRRVYFHLKGLRLAVAA